MRKIATNTEKVTLTISDFDATEYFYVETMEVDANKYDLIVLELGKVLKRIKKRKRQGHKEKGFTQYDIRRLQAAINGTCYACGVPHGRYATKVICKKCADKSKGQSNKRTQQLQDEHKCLTCGNLLPDEYKATKCLICKEKANDLRRKRRHKQKEECPNNSLLCKKCKKRRRLPESLLCEMCYFKDVSAKHLKTRTRWRELKSLWDKQEGICPYTNTLLIRGLDASIDHIRPQKRFPEQANDINNLEWVDIRINSMKNERTKIEFIEWLQSLIDNYQAIIDGYKIGQSRKE